MFAKVLVDNKSDDNFRGEWGLSIYIEYAGHKYLLDCGSSGLFAENAKEMGIDIGDVEYGILSHAHYDHANGMDTFFEKNSKARFYVRKGAEENCYSRHLFFNKYIGVRKGLLEEYKDRIEYVDGDYEIRAGAYLIPHKTANLDAVGKSGKMFVKRDGRLVYDDFSHEQSLVFDTHKGLVVFNSCSHAGADVIINEVRDSFPDKKIFAIIGGFHLFRSPEEKVREFAKRVRDTGIGMVVTGHCTGDKAYEILYEELGRRMAQLRVGFEINI